MNKELLKANLREIPDFPIPGILFYETQNAYRKCWIAYTNYTRIKALPK